MSQFEVRYYLVAILFLIFDIELVFLMPWILAFHYISAYLLLSMATFFFFLLIAFYYEWLIGGLEWD
jgi:NADH-quinone oxidoreductase subunit A